MVQPVGSLDSVALYRKYRPGSFGELLGQEQVTVPLSNALDSGRINHAYLFSGPRGCGKTSSARIMARSLNCEQGPTSTPCGQCASCIALAPNGPGNLDVTELDAASHNGVEDMRELRDRAAYAPADSRYRIFIIDEAHMITPQGANALLKVVEEPPAHLIFIFATTEPEKVIPTIRSRVHHYPFRLLTPQSMRTLVERTVASEGATVDDAVYPLVIRSGGGSPRDTLSVLDQLLAGAGPEGLTYETARMLLGATDDVLLDSVIDALGTGNAASLFQTVDDIIESGLDPRRFAQDLLDRLRDLMVLQAVPDAFDSGLVDAPTDRADILRGQANMFRPSDLPRLTALINDGLSGLKGATSPRLLLEILCAKMLLPSSAAVGAAPAQPAPAARPAVSGTAQASAAATAGAHADSTIPPKYERKSVRLAREKAEREAREAREAQKAKQEAEKKQESTPPAENTSAPQAPQTHAEPAPARASRHDQPAPVDHEPVEAPSAEPVGATKETDAEFTEHVRSNWSKIRSMVSKNSMVAGIMLAEAKILGFRDETLVLGHNTGALAERLNSGDNNAAIVKVIKAELNRDVTVQCIIGTDIAAAGFEPPRKTPQWNPNKPKEEAEGKDSSAEEHERSKPQDTSRVEPAPPRTQPREAEQEKKESPYKPPAGNQESQQEVQENATHDSFAQPRNQQQPAGQSDDIWGEPAPVGQDLPKATPLRTEPPQQSTAGNDTDDVWGAPAAIGQDRKVETSPAPTPVAQAAPQPEPEAPEQPARRSSWREKAARGEEKLREQEKHQFSDGSPLPPEPDNWDDAPPPEPDYGDLPEESFAPSAPAQPEQPPAHEEPAQPNRYAKQPHKLSRFERARAAAQAQEHSAPNVPEEEAPVYDQRAEEDEMIEAAAMEPGNRDRRDAMTVAMDMLAEELGAKKV